MLWSYAEAIETVFGRDVDYAQLVKAYVAEDSTYSPERKYSQPRIKSSEKFWIMEGRTRRMFQRPMLSA